MPIELGPPSWQYPLDAHWEQAFEQSAADASGDAASISRRDIDALYLVDTLRTPRARVDVRVRRFETADIEVVPEANGRVGIATGSVDVLIARAWSLEGRERWSL